MKVEFYSLSLPEDLYRPATRHIGRFLIKDGCKGSIKSLLQAIEYTGHTLITVNKSRYQFASEIRRFLLGEITRGSSLKTIRSLISVMKRFTEFMDEKNITPSINQKEMTGAFKRYDEHLYSKAWKAKENKKSTANEEIKALSRALTSILDLDPNKPLKRHSRVNKSFHRRNKVSVSPSGEKQNLDDTKKMGWYCTYLALNLTTDNITGWLPLEIDMQTPNGEQKTILVPKGLKKEPYKNMSKSSYVYQWEKSRKPNTDVFTGRRKELVKLRIYAELIIFIHQSGWNLQSAIDLSREELSYSARGNSEFEVKGKKARDGKGAGNTKTVYFNIYRNYKKWLQNYIHFLNEHYPEDGRLFPIKKLDSTDTSAMHYTALKTILERDGIPWIPPLELRNTRLNFLDAVAGNEKFTEAFGNHSRETFERNYKRPSQKRALASIWDFWSKDPMNPLQGGCNPTPIPSTSSPMKIAKPDCKTPSGCLWCESYKHIKSFDYIWNLVSYRQLKTFEASKLNVSQDNLSSSELVINRISDYLSYFQKLNKKCAQWVEKALQWMDEGNFHPVWKDWINALQDSSYGK